MHVVKDLYLSASTSQARIDIIAKPSDLGIVIFGICVDLRLMLVEEIFQFDRFGGGTYDDVFQILGVA
jgi:hypothetical protein